MSTQLQLEIYELVQSIVNNIAPHDPDKYDLIQDIFLVIIDKPPDLITRLYETNELRYYIVRIVKNMINSTSSQYWYTYKRFPKITSNIETIPTKLTTHLTTL